MANEPPVDVVIRPLTGPEVITGSTRLKAGTATKLVLNTLSTVAMVQLGKVYENLMIDLRTTTRNCRIVPSASCRRSPACRVRAARSCCMRRGDT